MTDQWNSRSGAHDAPAPEAGPDSSGRSGGWDGDRWRRPRRSTGDRKIAGVAGGLGRAFGVDPILLRVAFVVLTVFGGFGGLLYVLGWLLLPADGDEVSAGQALLGRGSSSVPPALTVGLGVVAVISALSMFSWGLPFLPLAVGGLIVLVVLHKRGHRSRTARYDWHGKDWQRSGTGAQWMPHTDDRVRRFSEHAQRWTEQAQRWGDQAQRWSDQAQRRGQQGRRRSGSSPWSCSAGDGSEGGRSAREGLSSLGQQPARSASSPFPQPPFWEQPAGARRPATDGSGPVDLTKQTAAQPAVDAGPAAGWLGPDGETRTTPPAWDPLGVAPFAWDLPEPTPLPDNPVRPGGRTVLPQVTMGATLLAGAVLAGGVFAGWWALTWAQVSGLTLAVLATGLLFSALRGGGRSLIGHGIFLSLVTLALSVTGLDGTANYGNSVVKPVSLEQPVTSYSINAGELTLDLTAVKIASGTTRTVDVEVRAGHALVRLPADIAVTAVCSADVGHTDCLGDRTDGLRRQSHGSIGGGGTGSLQLNVKVKAGFAEVVRGG